jgi:thiaminase/transcriptional activator TenA
MTTPLYSVGSARPTDHLWERAQKIRAEIDGLEFLRLLGDGTLDLAAFRTYIEQDRLYLAGYAKALSILASKAPDALTAAFWATSAAGAVEEAALHESLLSGDALPAADSVPEHSPTCLGYVSYLIATAAVEPYAVAAAAILPCFWIYADVASRLAVDAQVVLSRDPEHPYARWVSGYDSDEFRTVVDRARALVDEAADNATSADRDAMAEAFLVAARYELLFWDTALHPQSWTAAS